MHIRASSDAGPSLPRSLTSLSPWCTRVDLEQDCVLAREAKGRKKGVGMGCECVGMCGVELGVVKDTMLEKQSRSKD